MRKTICIFAITGLYITFIGNIYAGGHKKFDGYTKYASKILNVSENEIKIKQGTFKITDKTKFCIDEVVVKSYDEIKNIKEGCVTVDNHAGIVLEINDKLPSVIFNNGSFKTIYPDCYVDKKEKEDADYKKSFPFYQQ